MISRLHRDGIRVAVRKAKREDVYDGLQGIKRILRLLREGKVDKAKAIKADV